MELMNMAQFVKAKPELLTTKVKLFRYDPAKDERPRYENYEVQYEEGARIYSVLEYLRNELGVDLARRTSCKQRICGQCAVLVNGEPKLPCWDEALPEMTIEPLPNFPVIKDLVIDRREYDRRIQTTKPVLERLREPRRVPDIITVDDIEKLRPSEVANRNLPVLCIECLSCVSVCPVSDVGLGRFAGPAALNRLAQFAYDPRDKMTRMPDAFFHHIYDCTTCKQCEEVCPVNLAMPDRIEVTVEKLRALMATEGVGPLPEHLEFGKNAWETGRVILKRETTLLESLPEEVKAR
jgi:fumarate reductase (CoM/CoB) subunit B